MAESTKPVKEFAATQASGPRQVAGDAKAAAVAQVAEPAKSDKSTVLGDFRLLKKLGQGGMGTVYRAHQVSLDRPCALKVLSKELAAKPNFVERFEREARAMARIDHPNVVRCFAIGEARGLHYVAMELIEGQSMQDWLTALGKLSVGDALHVTLLCADALKHAHGLSMIHRDIKPDNILVTKKGDIKVSDLGLAKVLDEDMSMTQSGTGLGTPHYMPPEQARNAKYVDQRSDIYALGGTLYHFLTGSTPFKGDSIVQLITAKERGSFTPARRINTDVPERLDLILDKCLAKDPQYRYQTMDDLIRDLESLNLAAESLSFIDDPNKAVMHRAGAAHSPIVPTRAGFSAPTRAPIVPPTSAEDAKRSKSAIDAVGAEITWFVKHADPNGRTRISRMTTSQVRKGVKADMFDVSVRIARDAKGPFVTLAQVPEFEPEAHQLVTRTKAKAREQNLADTYAKLEKQYRRQKWWRLLARWRDGTLGLVGLIVYLAVVAAVLGGLIWGGIYLWQYIAAKYHLG
jgi:serine/threonine-protein kinase